MILKPKHKRPLMKQSGLVFYIIIQIGIRLQIIFFLLFFFKTTSKSGLKPDSNRISKDVPKSWCSTRSNGIPNCPLFHSQLKVKVQVHAITWYGTGIRDENWLKNKAGDDGKNGAVGFKEIVESYALWGHRGSLPAFVTITAMYIKVVPLNFLDPRTKCEMRGNVQKHSDI